MSHMTTHKTTLAMQAAAVRRVQSRTPRVFHLTVGQRRRILAEASRTAGAVDGGRRAS